MPGAYNPFSSPMIGSSTLLDGSPGLVPKPLAGEENKALTGSGLFISQKDRNYDDLNSGSSFSDSLKSTSKKFQSNTIFVGGIAEALTTASATLNNSFLQSADFPNNTVFYADAKLSMIKNDGTVISGAKRSCIIRKDNSGNLTLDYHPAAEIASAIVSAFAFSLSSTPQIGFTTGAAGANFRWCIEVRYTAFSL